ncbi:radical S-adenosyl methionine domain-containing protein 1, mitochondrial [Elysia marginata]|uniref:Radical S-adenosyl methionine domain-containing protein 1, mitochondrial n=1 Tax=Elysia marginata TaxID=1093978 RepID=A0AAV4EM67_9GAST|nr:radical S-adenosyl methionine domain-containing protein 1, mitochondrial [Elysia marginata]
MESCLETASTLFPGKVSLDLIFGWPGQTMDMWVEELKQILHVCDKHLSLYQLTVEKGTQLYTQVKSGELHVASPDLSEDMYLHAVQFLERNGFERYEISNFAKEEQYCIHNISYWNGGEYIGVGPGAHGRFMPVGKSEREARVQTLSPDAWMKEVEMRGHGTRSVLSLSPHERLEELLVVGLRTKWGIPHQTWSELQPQLSLTSLTQSPVLQQYFESGLLELRSRGLRASKKGMNVIDTIIVSLLDVLNEGQGSRTSVT